MERHAIQSPWNGIAYDHILEPKFCPLTSVVNNSMPGCVILKQVLSKLRYGSDQKGWDCQKLLKTPWEEQFQLDLRERLQEITKSNKLWWIISRQLCKGWGSLFKRTIYYQLYFVLWNNTFLSQSDALTLHNQEDKFNAKSFLLLMLVNSQVKMMCFYNGSPTNTS